VLRVLKTKPGWVKAEFGKDRMTSGWIKTSDLFAAEPERQEQPSLDNEAHPIEKWTEACLEKDRSTAGMVSCSDKAYKKWDQELNRIYKTLRRKLSHNSKAKKALRNAQRAWLKYQNAEMKTIEVIYGSLQGTMWIPVAGFAKVEIIKKRTLILKGYLDDLQMGAL